MTDIKKKKIISGADFTAPYIDYKLGDYMEYKPLNEKFLEGRHTNRPHFREGSSMERAWYDEQADRCINGFTHRGRYMNPLYYFFLNFMIFDVVTTDKNGKVTGVDVGYPLYSRVDEYVFDIMWQAKKGGWHVSLMGGRGLGKSFFFTSVLLRGYIFYPENVGFITATNENLAGPAWTKVFDTLGRIEKFHPGFKHKRILSSEKKISSGFLVTDEHGEHKEGFNSQLRKIVYGKDAGVTRGTRPHEQLIEEFAAFPGEDKKGSLKEVFMQSKGSWVINNVVRQAFVMLSGTGGSVENDEAKELFIHPERYDIYPIHEWGMASGIFVPVHYKTGTTWEKDGVPDIEKALLIDDGERDKLKDDPKSYQNRLQEYPRTIEEVFKRNGTNIFNQELISKQWAYLNFEANTDGEDHNKFVEKGELVWKKDDSKKVIGVEFVKNNVGPVHIVEHPTLDPEGKQYEGLYIMGLDSIDQGDADSAGRAGEHSKMGALVKKRIVEGRVMEEGFSNNLYVAYYNERSYHVEDDYENVLKLSYYYNSMINLEYTKIGILSYFRFKKQSWRFMLRPSMNRPPNTDPEKLSNLIGTTTASNIIKHGDGKIKEYIDSYYSQIFFIPLLDQLRQYDAENRTKWDLVVAMNLAEVADDDFAGKAAFVEATNQYEMSNDIGSYIDDEGRRRYGIIPKKVENKFQLGSHKYNGQPLWYDENDEARFDDNYTDDKRKPILRLGDEK